MENLQLIQTVTIVALVIFALAMVAIGIISTRKAKTVDGFLLGNRKIGAWVSAFAYGTAYFSAVVFVGYAGQHGWNIGLGSLWIGIGNAILGCLVAWLLLAKRSRTMTHTLNVKTMPGFFESRYDCKALKIFSAIIIFVFLVPYSAAVYKGLGTMFQTVFPSVPINVWLLIIAVLTAAYLVLGGYVATAYTDFVQGIIMIVGVIAMVIAVVNSPNVGGFSNIISGLSQLKDGEQLTSWFGGASWRFLCVNILLTSFGTWGLPQMVSKYYAIKDVKSIKRATIISTVFSLIIGCGAYFIGSLSRLILPALPAGGVDSVIPNVLVTALGGGASIVPVIIFAVILVLLLSASMSTLSSIVLSSSSSISVDLIPAIKKGYSEKNQMLLTRILCLVFVGLSYLFATANISIIVNIMSFSWGIVSGCFIGPYIWGIYSKKITKAGAWAGMICGFLTVAIPTIVLAISGGSINAAAAKAPEMGVCAMAVSIVVVPIVSAFTKKFDDKFLEGVFAIKEEDK